MAKEKLIAPRYRLKVKQRLGVVSWAMEHGIKPADAPLGLDRKTIREWRDRIDTEEFWWREAPPDFMTALPALQAWERRYNFARFSVALKGETPAERLQRLLPDVKVA